jgi:D-glycero-D-manno-heptose 1,7-bisphosphate phosphatase
MNAVEKEKGVGKRRNKAVFLDRDGSLVDDPGYVHKIRDFKFLPGVVAGLQKLSKNFIFIIVTNQSGINRGIFSHDDFRKFNDYTVKKLKENNIEIKKTYYCPHTPEEVCGCRKPGTKYIDEAAKEFDIDVKSSWVIGDHPHDAEMGIRAGSKSIYLLTGHGKKHLDDLKKKHINPDFIAENFAEAADFILRNL